MTQPALGDAMYRWSNFPQAVLGHHGRRGLLTSSLSAGQWGALDGLLATVTGGGSANGVCRVRDHLATDDHLLTQGGRHGYGRGQFVVAVIGRPGPAGRWTLMFGGHHLALLRTWDDDRLSGATPSFRGVEPLNGFATPERLVDPERRLRHATRDLVGGLADGERRAARLPHPVTDLLMGPGVDTFPPRGDGALARTFTPDSRARIVELLASFVDDVPRDESIAVLDTYRRHLDDTQLAIAASPRFDQVGDYLRVDGPAVWIEVAMQPGVVLPGPHLYAVWRDRRDDYGAARIPLLSSSTCETV